VKKPLTLAEVKALVHERWSKDQASLTKDQKRLFEYLAKFVKVDSPEACREAVNRIVEEVGIAEEDAVMIVNIMPETRDELRPLLFRRYPLLDAEAYNKILEILRDLKEKAGRGGRNT